MVIKIAKSDLHLLKNLQNVMTVTGNEEKMNTFLLKHIRKNMHKWKRKPKIIHGKELGNMIMLVFGKPRTAVLAHMDTVGFMTAHNNRLLRLGGSKEKNRDKLYGFVKNKPVTATLVKKEKKISFRSKDKIPLGTVFSYVSDWKETKDYIINGGMDDCVGMLVLLYIARKLENGILVFTQREEGGTTHGGLGSIAKIIHKKYKVNQILISDVTSTNPGGIAHKKGAVVGVGIKELPNPQFIQKIYNIAGKYDLFLQPEIRETGLSDFTRLLRTPYLFDMCFVGVPVSNKHSSSEKIYKKDIINILNVYSTLMKYL